MSLVKLRDMTRQQTVSLILRHCALLIDPLKGELKDVAAILEVHPVTVSEWIRQGYVPQHQVARLEKRFGKKQINLDDLCPPENRR